VAGVFHRVDEEGLDGVVVHAADVNADVYGLGVRQGLAAPGGGEGE
jgi:hypothetical protein